jgi:UDP-glucose 4-epimerase
MPKYKTALVTGGAGFIGSHIVDALIKRHIKVYVVDDLSTGSKSNVNPNATFYKLSVASPEFPNLLRKIKPEVVFHLAAQIDVRNSVADPPADARVNIMGTLAIAHTAGVAGVQKIIFTSSGGAMYPDTFKPPYTEKTPEDPLSPYAISKKTAEMYLQFEHRVHGTPVTILRLANVYGPRQALRGEAGVVALFAKKLLRGEQTSITGSGKQTRDFVYVGDVVRAQMLAMEKKATGIFNIGTGVQTSINHLFRKMNTITQAHQTEVHVAPCPGEVMRSALDARKACRELGWEPQVGLEEGLKRTVDWFRKYSK